MSVGVPPEGRRVMKGRNREGRTRGRGDRRQKTHRYRKQFTEGGDCRFRTPNRRDQSSVLGGSFHSKRVDLTHSRGYTGSPSRTPHPVLRTRPGPPTPSLPAASPDAGLNPPPLPPLNRAHDVPVARLGTQTSDSHRTTSSVQPHLFLSSVVPLFPTPRPGSRPPVTPLCLQRNRGRRWCPHPGAQRPDSHGELSGECQSHVPLLQDLLSDSRRGQSDNVPRKIYAQRTPLCGTCKSSGHPLLRREYLQCLDVKECSRNNLYRFRQS